MAEPEKVEAQLRILAEFANLPEGCMPLASFTSLVYINPDGREMTHVSTLGVPSIGRPNLIGGAFQGLCDWAVHPESFEHDHDE